MATTTPYKRVTHVIFDIDGLLLDTEGLFTDIMNSICEPHGKKFTWEVKVKQMGKKTEEAAKVLISELDLPITVEDYAQQVQMLVKKTFPEAKLMPGADKLVRHLNAHNIPIALATGSSREEYDMKTSKHHTELFSLFKHAVFSTCDPEVKNGKPAPDCFLVCASRYPDKPNPEQVLVFEDAPNGMQGALAAKMQVVWIPDPNVDKSAVTGEATLTLSSLEDFKPELFGLPAYDS